MCLSDLASLLDTLPSNLGKELVISTYERRQRGRVGRFDPLKRRTINTFDTGGAYARFLDLRGRRKASPFHHGNLEVLEN
jgi:hypothetical protein